MRPRWRKVFTDLFENKLRTLLVVFSIAVGVLSIGVISGAYAIISNDMSASYAANQPANIEVRMADFGDDLLTNVRNQRDIADAEGRRVFSIRARPQGASQWTTISIVAIDDFAKNKINLLTPIEGSMDPAKRQIVIERDVLKEFSIEVGGQLEFQLPNGSIKTLPVVGIVQDPTTGADDFLSPPLSYVTMDTLPTLLQPQSFNRIYATVTTGQDDMSHIRNAATDLKDRIEKSGYAVGRTRSSKTHEHPLAATVNAVLGILLALGVLIVFLSSSLIANTLSALLNQHLRHIGVMKLVGGRDRQIFGMYLVLILAFGVLSLLIAVPLGGQGAFALSQYIASQLGFSLLGYRIVPLAFAIQIAMGLLIPLVAGFVPVINGSRVTVLKAISGDQAGGGETGQMSRFDRFQMRATAGLARRGIHIPRPLLISMRNTFRRRGRLILTLFTLTMGGAIFIAVFNVRVTLFDYIGSIGNYFLADVTLDFSRPYRTLEVEQHAMQVEGVAKIEGWLFLGAEILYPDGTAANNMNILAPPADSELVDPILVGGRWIQAGDEKKIAISEAILGDFPGLKPGDTLRLRVNGKNEDWEVVGIFKFIGREGILAYAPYDYIAHITDMANQSYSYRVVTTQHDRPSQDAMSERLDRFFRDDGFDVLQARAGLATLDTASESLGILVTFLLIMALLTATVGSMGLTGTMGMNVLERTREIGIMRAIGATDRIIMLTVMVEGMVIGTISWVLGAILSIPITMGLAYIVSIAVFETPIKIIYTVTGYLIWLGLVLVLSAIASVMPARNAAHMTIREVLAYE